MEHHIIIFACSILGPQWGGLPYEKVGDAYWEFPGKACLFENSGPVCVVVKNPFCSCVFPPDTLKWDLLETQNPSTLYHQVGWKCSAVLTLSLPSSKRTFSQPFKEKCMREVVRIGSTIIFHLSISYENSSSSYCVMSYFWRGWRGNLKFITLGSERVN